MFNEPGGYSANVNRGVLPGFQEFRPSDAFYAPYYGLQGVQDTNAAQERIAGRTIDAHQSTLQSLAPALFSVLGSFGGGSGGGGYQTDYGAGLRPQQPQGGQQPQQQTFRGYAQPQQQPMGGGMGGNPIEMLMRVLSQFRQ